VTSTHPSSILPEVSFLSPVDGGARGGESGVYKADRGTMKILFYGRLAEAIALELEVGASPGSSVADVRERLAAEHPGAAAVLRNERALSLVRDRLVRDDYCLAAGDTLEFLPPVSGG